MRIVIPGGTGQIGRALCQVLHDQGHEVVVLSRGPGAAPWRIVPWNGQTLGAWVADIDGADVVINLAGRSVNCRYHSRNRREIITSRIDSTRVLGEAIIKASNPPAVWLQSSTATIYAHRYDKANDEDTGVIGGSEPFAPEAWRFSIDVATAWEDTCERADTPYTRKVLMRTAIVMSPGAGSPFDLILGMVRRGLGGRNGDGRQFVSWIHEQDFIRAVNWIIEHDDLHGPVNLAAPDPLPNADFMRELRKAWGIRFGMPSAAWMLEIATLFMRSESELVLKSRCVVPRRLLDSGFNFDYPTWPEAAVDLCRRWREGHAQTKT